MKLWHTDANLEHEGLRIRQLRDQGHPLSRSDLEFVERIVADSERLALNIVGLYGLSFLAVFAILAAIEYVTSFDTAGLLAGAGCLAFLGFGIHFLSAFRIDNHRSAIEKSLVCQTCGKKVSGYLVGRLSANLKCPHCHTPLRGFFAATEKRN